MSKICWSHEPTKVFCLYPSLSGSRSKEARGAIRARHREFSVHVRSGAGSSSELHRLSDFRQIKRLFFSFVKLVSHAFDFSFRLCCQLITGKAKLLESKLDPVMADSNVVFLLTYFPQFQISLGRYLIDDIHCCFS